MVEIHQKLTYILARRLKKMKLIMENWNKFVAEQEKYKFDPSNMEKMASDAASSRRELDAKVDKVGDVIAQDPDRFLDGAQSIEDVESRIEAVAREMYDIPGLSVEDLNTVYAKLRDHFGFDLDSADPDEFPLEEEEVLRFINEEVDRMISEGLLEEGFKDKMIKFLTGLTLAGAVLGGMPGEARADLDPVAAKTAVVKVMNQKAEKAGLKDQYGFDLQFQEADPRMDNLGDALSDLTKASDMDDAKLVDKVANSILINLTPEEKGGEAPASLSNALEVGIETTRETAKKVKKQNKGQKKTGQAKFTNYEGAVANAYNGMQLAFSQDDETAQNKAVDELFDTLDAAEKAGALDGKAGQAKKLLGKGDIKGFRKLMGY
jgi:hypothetical protein